MEAGTWERNKEELSSRKLSLRIFLSCPSVKVCYHTKEGKEGDIPVSYLAARFYRHALLVESAICVCTYILNYLIKYGYYVCRVHTNCQVTQGCGPDSD
jgi:hypothetical protein